MIDVSSSAARQRTPKGAWRWPALAMFAVAYGANHFVPLLAVYREARTLSDAQATAIFGVYALGLIPGFCSPVLPATGTAGGV